MAGRKSCAKINGSSFSVFCQPLTFQVAEFGVKLPDGRVVSGFQEQHIVLLGDRAIGFALTYNTVAEGETLRNIVWSLKLDESREEEPKE